MARDENGRYILGQPNGRAVPVGSTLIAANGYVCEKVAGSRKWLLQHRLVWERANGPIPPGGCIHHRNAIRTDNRIENLELCESNSAHRRKHRGDTYKRRPPPSAETRQKLRDAWLRRDKGPDWRAKMSDAGKKGAAARWHNDG